MHGNNMFAARVFVADNNINLHNQWNIWDSLDNRVSKLHIGDYDRNGLKEIYLFSKSKDSLFLNANEFFNPTGLHFKKQFVTKFGSKDPDDASVFITGLQDGNGDGKGELYFTITTGFGLWPRLAYYVDLVSKQVNSSPYTSINMNYAEMKDVDRDGRVRHALQTRASEEK